MTNDKMRQDFEAWQGKTNCHTIDGENGFVAGYQAGRAAEREAVQTRIAALDLDCERTKSYNSGVEDGYNKARAEIREKLESEEMATKLAGVLSWHPERGNLDCAKAAITKILEVI